MIRAVYEDKGGRQDVSLTLGERRIQGQGTNMEGFSKIPLILAAGHFLVIGYYLLFLFLKILFIYF